MTGIRLTPAAAWLALIALTAISVGTAERFDFGFLAELLIVALAGAKGAIVLEQYMEIGHVRAIWRRLYFGWLAGVTLILLALTGWGPVG